MTYETLRKLSGRFLLFHQPVKIAPPGILESGSRFVANFFTKGVVLFLDGVKL